jgi:hypothetical protein
MKISKRWTLGFFTLLALVAFTGCSQFDKAYDRQIVTTPGQVIGTNTVLLTNTVPVVAADGSISQTQVITPVSTLQYAPAVTVTNLVPMPNVQHGIEFAKSLPIPWAGTAGGILGLIYSAYAAIRNKKTAVALVQGVEAFRTWAQTTPEGKAVDAKLLRSLKEHQEISGVLNQVAKLVNDHTGNTVEPAT